jgi:hypothetical protein
MSHAGRCTLRDIVALTLFSALACCITEGKTPVPEWDAGGSTPDASSQSPYDGTVGHPCSSDADCISPTGPGQNRCSLTALQDGPLLPTPVCVLPSCDPGTDGNIHRCDGPDGDATTPGVCYDLGGGSGVCLPGCSFAADGSAARGCSGKNVCNFYGSGTDSSGAPYGVGYCLGGCTANADCPRGSSCDTTTGLCLTTVTPPTLSLGQACNATAPDPGCNCFGNLASGDGYCSTFCITGSKTAGCPAGYVCDPTEPAASSLGGSNLGFPKVTPGLAGWCLASCNIESGGDAGPEAGDAMSGDAANESGDGGGDASAGDAMDSAGEASSDASDDESVDATNDGPPEASDDGPADALGAGLGETTGDGGAPADAVPAVVCPAPSTCSVGNVAGPDCLP